MSTIRLQIVNAIATALGTATGLTVWRNLDFALETEKLPALVVMSGDDSPEPDLTQNQVLDQTVAIEVTVLIANSATPEASADPYEADVHSSLLGAASFGGHPVMIDRISGGWNFDLGDCAARHLNYRIAYRTRFADLESA